MSNSLGTVLSTLSKGSQTLGWDVVAAYNASAINDMMVTQYVTNLKASQNLPPMSGTTSIAGSTLHYSNLVLGPPLISFPADLANEEVLVTMSFLSGSTYLINSDNNYCMQYQNIAAAEQLAVLMTIPLSSVQGSASSQNDVVIDLTKPAAVTTQLIGSSAGALLGQYFSTIISKAPSDVPTSFTMGTLVTGTSENLTPYQFSIYTQPGPNDGSSSGSVLLFISTTYTKQNGTLPSSPSSYPYLIPDNHRAAVLIKNETVLQYIMAPALQTAVPGLSATTVVKPSGNGLFDLSFSGSTSIGVVSGTSGFTTWWSGNSLGQASVPLPFNGLSLGADSQSYLLSINWSQSWNQSWGSSTVTAYGPITTSGTATITLTANLTSAAQISQSDGTVSFAGSGTPGVTFPPGSWWQKFSSPSRQKALSAVAGGIKTAAQNILNVPLPQVDAFPVSHLLFPAATSALSFNDAAFPGDLALFGDIRAPFTISPMQAVCAAGGTIQFTASTPTSDTVQWTVSSPGEGSISDSGLFTAPSAVTQPYVLSVTATDTTTGIAATAAVTLVPTMITMTPAYVLIQPPGSPGDNTITLYAAVATDSPSVTWSITSPSPTIGTLTPSSTTTSATYTLPSKFPASPTVVQITASISSPSAASAVATLLLAGSINFTVTPGFVSLGAGSTEQFISGETAATWSLLPPASGQISGGGTYTASSTIPVAGTDVVLSTLGGGGSQPLYGIGIVSFTP